MILFETLEKEFIKTVGCINFFCGLFFYQKFQRSTLLAIYKFGFLFDLVVFFNFRRLFRMISSFLRNSSAARGEGISSDCNFWEFFSAFRIFFSSSWIDDCHSFFKFCKISGVRRPSANKRSVKRPCPTCVDGSRGSENENHLNLNQLIFLKF